MTMKVSPLPEDADALIAFAQAIATVLSEKKHELGISTEVGRLAYRMKTPWRDGTTHVIMSDGELVEKLAALVPAPRFHLVRYFGVLASAAKQRASIVPLPPPASTTESCRHRNAAEEQ